MAKGKKKSQGLGDTIEKITKATGIDKLVKFIAGEDCGCSERKEKLNAMFPYQRPLCLEEHEYEYLKGYYESNIVQVKHSVQVEILKIFNRIFRQNLQPTSCSDCYRDIHHKLLKVYETYKEENDANTNS